MSGAKHFRDGTSPEHPHGAGVETSHTFRDRCEDITSILGHLSSQAAKLIDSHEVFDESVHNQSTALREAGNIRANDRIKVGIVGASEMGKSSTLNALIHQKDLCKTDAGIEGCTSATCEVTGSEMGQTAPYLVKVTFYSEDEISKMLSEYIDDFCTLKFDQDELAVCSGEESRRLQNNSGTLLQLIATLLLKGTIPQTEEEITVDLKGHYEQKTTKMYKQTMVEQCCKLVENFDGGSCIFKTFTFQTMDETIAFAHPLGSTDDPDGHSRSMWPLVKRIRICIRDHVLLQDIIIGDAPGISDINHCRVRNSYEYLDTCDFLMVVTSIQTRMASDTHVAAVLDEYGDRFQGKLVMVVTRSDDPIESKQMSRLLKKAEKLGYFDKVQEYAKVSEDIKDVKRRMRDRTLSEYDVFTIRTQELTPLQQSLYEMSIGMRSEVFRTKFLQKKNMNVPMVFVSNMHYWRHSEIEDEVMDSGDLTLELQATGIPFLRRVLTSLPMKLVFRCLDEYRQRFISLAEALKTVVEREPPKDPVLMKQLTDCLMADATKLSMRDPFEYGVVQNVVNVLGTNDIIAGLASLIDMVSSQYCSVLHQGREGVPYHRRCTIRAIIRRKGVFKSSSQIRYDWPQFFTDCAVAQINQAFRNMENFDQVAMNNHTYTIENLVNEFSRRVAAHKHDLGITEIALQEMIGTFRRLIHLHIESFKEKYNKAMANVKLNATKSRDSNYSGLSLSPLFAELVGESGIGYKKRVVTGLQDYVDSKKDNIITPALQMFFDALRSVKSEHVATLDAENMREVRFLCSKLTCAMGQGGAFEAAQADGRRFLKKVKGKGMDFIERLMQSLKDDIDKWVTDSADDLKGESLVPVEDGVAVAADGEAAEEVENQDSGLRSDYSAEDDHTLGPN